MVRIGVAMVLAALGMGGHAVAAATINVVVAENFYAEAVRAVGGDNVNVTVVIESPSADPHEFEPTPATARQVADADVVVFNGIDYDPWMDRLLAASRAPQRTVIDVAELLQRKTGDNPHLWYDPAAVPALVDAVAKALASRDPTDAASFDANAKSYRRQLAAIAARVAEVKAKYARTPVTATEPVFGYMAQALGLDMRNGAFQLAVMNGTEPSGRDTAALETDLKTGKAKVLFYNSQVTDGLTEQLLSLARAAHVPVVGVTETEPAGETFIDWMLSEIDATEKALAGPPS
jgi:zinc/manganese transport system substrate-binding protein